MREGRVIGRGVTQPGGRPHAELEALGQAGADARGATLYVTLEPCAKRSSNHYGASCSEAIIAAGVARVVIATEDPSPMAAGAAVTRMRSAGVEVVTGVLRNEGYRLNLGHFRRVTDGRPLITLKLAQTLDGFAAGPSGSARVMITGAAANRRVQWMRAAHDAILVGAATMRADDPRLNVRLDLLPARRPVRVVLDTAFSMSPQSHLARSAATAPVWVVGGEGAGDEHCTALNAMGVETLHAPRAAGGHLYLRAVLGLLAARGLTRVFCEGGPTLAGALLSLDVVDEVALFTSSRNLEHGIPALAPSARADLNRPERFRIATRQWVGADRLEIFERHL